MSTVLTNLNVTDILGMLLLLHERWICLLSIPIAIAVLLILLRSWKSHVSVVLVVVVVVVAAVVVVVGVLCDQSMPTPIPSWA